MPQFTSTPTLEVFYSDDVQGTYTYSYNSLPMLSALTDESQLQIIWRCAVVIDSNLNTISVASFSDAEQEILQTLSPSMYTINATNKTVTLIPGNIQGSNVVLNGAVYTYSSFSVTSATPLFIRRSTDVTGRAITFQPGSRLTSGILNAANSQVFNAIQELAAFGAGGGGGAVGNVDLSSNTINELSDVDLTSNGVLSWDGSEVTSGSSGSLVPPDSTAQVGMVLVKETGIIGDIGWGFIQWPNVYNVPSGQPNRISLDVQLSNMTTDIQSNSADINTTSALVSQNSDAIAYSAYVTLTPNAYQTSLGGAATVDIASTSGDSSSDVNMFLYTTGNRFSNMDTLANMCPVGNVAYNSGGGFSSIIDCMDNAGANFFSLATTSNGICLFKIPGLYRVDLSGIFGTSADSVAPASGGFRVRKNNVGGLFGQNAISALPASTSGTEYISNSFLIPVTQADVDNESEYAFYITNNRLNTAGTSEMTASRIQMTLARVGEI